MATASRPTDHTGRPTGVLALLGEPVYRSYWLANFFYFLVFGAQRFAFVLFVLELTDRAGLGGLVGFALGIPAFFITVPAGVWADRLDRRRMVMASCLAGAAMMAVVAALTLTGLINAPVALVAALAIGFVTASVQPPLTAIVQMIVPPEHLVSGIVLRTMGQNLAQFVGAVAGGVTIATLDFGGAFAVQSTLYLVAFVCLLGVRL
ncbi:MAG: hypothetical protein CVU47_10505, partial [Chloroflexi bacterium HGW-Chloroflexi-9]